MKWLWVVLVAMPTTIAAQTYTACPTPSTKTISVSAGGITATSKITIVDRPAPTPFIDERYGYADVQTFTNAPNTGTVYANPVNLQMEAECGALRYLFTPSGGDICEKYYSGYDLKFPQNASEVFVEVWARFDSTFAPQRFVADSTQCLRTGPQPISVDRYHQSGFLFLLGRVDNNTGGFGVTFGTGYPREMVAEAGSPCYLGVLDGISKQLDEDERHMCTYRTLSSYYANALYGGYNRTKPRKQWIRTADYSAEFGNALMRFDGKWHRYRFWFKPGLGGSISVWLDDDHLGMATASGLANQMIGLSIGRFLWHQPVKQQYVDFGRVRVWTSNPGWNTCEAFCWPDSFTTAPK